MKTIQLSSNNKRILLFSDIHQEIRKARYILEKEDHDEIVNLGDNFDSFEYDSVKDIENTCQFLKDNVFKPNYHSLFGNHDLHYFYPSQYTICSGYEPWKLKAVNQWLGSLKSDIIAQHQWFIWVDDYLCTHAGLHPNHINPMIKLTKESLTHWLIEQGSFASASLDRDDSHWLYRAGEARGGNQNLGGITWLDADVEAEMIIDLKQIFGHTPHPTVLPHVEDGCMNVNDWINIDIDCHLNQYLIIQNGRVEIKNYNNL